MTKVQPDPARITPQISPSIDTKPAGAQREKDGTSRPPSSSRSRPGSRATSPTRRVIPDTSGVPQYLETRVNKSAPGSRQTSPTRKGSSAASTSGNTSTRSSVALPPGEADNPYARNRRPPQAHGPESVDARFAFSTSKDSGRHPSGGDRAQLKAQPGDAHADARAQHRKSGIFSNLYHLNAEDEANKDQKHHTGSMHDLKRFFKFGHKHKEKDKERQSITTSSRKGSKAASSGTQTPPHHRESSVAVPFSDDHSLESKYGKFGKMLGSGAGGSVRLMKRSSDGTTFAVKQFRERHAYENERDYNKKVTAEFCVGSTLHHGNIIETMDIVQERGRWYEVMEYAPFDLFANVMTGRMSREETACTVMQIMNGVQYLHAMGLAHRDLKLDNVVVNDRGIMKLIDFGSAVVFRYPFETDVVRASGIVGSDPYLAPEVYDAAKYAPQAVDVWSLAIIYCCMALRRFPWKLPRNSDVSYKYFVAEASPGCPSLEDLRNGNHVHRNHHHRNALESGNDNSNNNSTTSSSSTTAASDRPETPHGKDSQPNANIKGPWRLLRLLPRESRYIIGRMLDTNPDTRATLDEVFEDPWFAERECCRQEESGKVVRVSGHDHVLEPTAGSSAGGDGKKP